MEIYIALCSVTQFWCAAGINDNLLSHSLPTMCQVLYRCEKAAFLWVWQSFMYLCRPGRFSHSGTADVREMI